MPRKQKKKKNFQNEMVKIFDKQRKYYKNNIIL